MSGADVASPVHAVLPAPLAQEGNRLIHHRDNVHPVPSPRREAAIGGDAVMTSSGVSDPRPRRPLAEAVGISQPLEPALEAQRRPAEKKNPHSIGLSGRPPDFRC